MRDELKTESKQQAQKQLADRHKNAFVIYKAMSKDEQRAVFMEFLYNILVDGKKQGADLEAIERVHNGTHRNRRV